MKKELAEKFIDLLEIGSQRDESDYRKIVFPHIGFERPLVTGSDNHNVRTYSTRCPCWIKADPTFPGLRIVLREPRDRVYLGDSPPALQWVRENQTKYIRSIAIRKKRDSPLAETWFDARIPLNHGLVAIIGKKGSGKSALADIIALLGDSPHGDSFSFLNNAKFRQSKDNKARHFEGDIVWESGSGAVRNLDDPVERSALESVKYVPQSYLEKVCNELSANTQSAFDKELESVIFSHIDDAHRLGYDSLDGLLAYQTTETGAAIGQLRSRLRFAVQTLVGLEEKESKDYRKSLENQLAMKKRELLAHDAAKPREVKEPESDASVKDAVATTKVQIASFEGEIKTLDVAIGVLMAKRAKLARQIAAADRLVKRAANLQIAIRDFRDESALDCAELGLDVDSIVTIKIRPDVVSAAKRQASEELHRLEDDVDPAKVDGPAGKKVQKEKALEKLREKLDEPNRAYQAYLGALEKWRDTRDAIEGDEHSQGSLKYWEAQVASLASISEEVQQARTACRNLAMKIFGEISALADLYRQVYAPVQRFIQEHPLAKGRFRLEFEASIVPERFEERFLEHVNRTHKGSFFGPEGVDRIRNIVGEADFDSEPKARAFIETIERHLLFDLRDHTQEPVSVQSQLAKGVTPEDVYNFLYAMDYLKPSYTLRWEGKDIGQLSPGERGTLLLVFYLLIDRSNVPLIIDQPEENLDNQTVFDILVPSIKEAKRRRQIVIVTHNPNLAVVCDADQVIHASLDKDDKNRITYTCGAIEKPEINQMVLDVLEGTRPAFENREGKYQILP